MYRSAHDMLPLPLLPLLLLLLLLSTADAALRDVPRDAAGQVDVDWAIDLLTHGLPGQSRPLLAPHAVHNAETEPEGRFFERGDFLLGEASGLTPKEVCEAADKANLAVMGKADWALQSVQRMAPAGSAIGDYVGMECMYMKDNIASSLPLPKGAVLEGAIEKASGGIMGGTEMEMLLEDGERVDDDARHTVEGHVAGREHEGVVVNSDARPTIGEPCAKENSEIWGVPEEQDPVIRRRFMPIWQQGVEAMPKCQFMKRCKDQIGSPWTKVHCCMCKGIKTCPSSIKGRVDAKYTDAVDRMNHVGQMVLVEVPDTLSCKDACTTGEKGNLVVWNKAREFARKFQLYSITCTTCTNMEPADQCTGASDEAELAAAKQKEKESDAKLTEELKKLEKENAASAAKDAAEAKAASQGRAPPSPAAAADANGGNGGRTGAGVGSTPHTRKPQQQPTTGDKRVGGDIDTTDDCFDAAADIFHGDHDIHDSMADPGAPKKK